ncbi:DUF6364 family protein [Salibacterium lacus]|uniref:DUF6364 family protein n=1 Tax=Salibacterium lacus TaxID=1898109 RepID=A0ABW5SWZ4_9BACI
MADRKRFTLRMDENLFEKIEEQAERNKRSVAKEIEHLLENKLDDLEGDDDNT